VAELPEGYCTPVGKGGVPLSPSQALRLKIAALLAVDTAEVVLDDPTAGLDAAGEAAVLPGLERLIRDRRATVVSASPAVRAALARSPRATPSPAVPPVPEDPALPSLGTLLDAQAMSPVLGRLVTGTAVDVRVHSVRYKPGDNVVVQYSVLTPTGWDTAVAYSRTGYETRRKRGNRAKRKLARRLGNRVHVKEALTYVPEVSAVVQWMPLDVLLPVLGDAPERLARRLAQKGLVADGEPELLRYWPRRRAVLRFGPYVLKAYRDTADFEQARRALRASRKLRRVQTPAYAGRLKVPQVTVQEWVPGVPPSLRPDGSAVAGSLLADLHADVRLKVPQLTAADVLAKTTIRADFAADLLPDLRPQLQALLSDLAARVPRDETLVTSHGNFHAGQLLAGPAGLVLLDVDRLCSASPAYDLASFAAHLAFGRPREAAVVGTALESLCAGYGSRPEHLAWYLATFLVRRTVVPFRCQDDQWAQSIRWLVEYAGEVLR